MLALAAFLYLPIVISGKFEIRSDKSPDKSLKTPGSVAALLLLAKLTDLDIVYTLIERIASGVCPRESTVTAAWVYYGIIVLAFLVFSLLAINFYMFNKVIQRTRHAQISFLQTSTLRWFVFVWRAIF